MTRIGLRSSLQDLPAIHLALLVNRVDKAVELGVTPRPEIQPHHILGYRLEGQDRYFKVNYRRRMLVSKDH